MNSQIRHRISVVVLFILIISLIIILGKNIRFDVDQARTFLLQYPLWLSGIIYILLYVVSTTLIWVGPQDVVRVFGALFYGGAVSTLLIYIADIINAAILFHLSRKIGRDVVLKKWFRKDNIDKARDRTTFLGIMSLRINVLIPYRFLDLAYGLTRVPFAKYLAVVLIVSPLRLFVIQYAIVLFWDVFKSIKTFDQAAIIRMALEMSNIMMREPMLIKSLLAYLGLLILVSIAAVIEKIVLRRSKEEGLKNVQAER